MRLRSTEWMKRGRGEPSAQQSSQKLLMKMAVSKHLYIQSVTNRSAVAADTKQDIHLLWEKTEAELLSLAQGLPTMVDVQGRPPPSQACEAFILFCPSKFAERRKLIPHPQSNSAVTPFSEPLSMLSQGAQAAQELPAGRDQAYGEVEKGKGRKPLSTEPPFISTERDLSSVVKKPTKILHSPLPPPPPQH